MQRKKMLTVKQDFVIFFTDKTHEANLLLLGSSLE